MAKDMFFWDIFAPNPPKPHEMPFLLIEVSTTAWILGFMAAFVIGVSKAGIKGVAVINVTSWRWPLAQRNPRDLWCRYWCWRIFSPSSTTIGIPMELCVQSPALDDLGHGNWCSGGQDLPEDLFKLGMAGIIIITVFMMYWWDRKKNKTVPTHWAFASTIGILAGFTTMVGNLAGAFSNIYFLAMRLPKNHFIGTAAWLFLIVNIFKLPFHIFVWHTISADTLWLNLKLVPGIFVGFYAGVRIVKHINESFFRKMILVLTATGAVLMLLN
jgi:uncharacterized protein